MFGTNTSLTLQVTSQPAAVIVTGAGRFTLIIREVADVSVFTILIEETSTDQSSVWVDLFEIFI